jgi:glycosyltransferase involved in cell wall biosynthesis
MPIKMLKYDITFPVYNEEVMLERCIKETIHFCNNTNFQAAIITIADNGSTDNTGKIGRSLEKQFDQVRYIPVDQKGVGIALKTAWKKSPCDIVGTMDLDLSTELRHLNEVRELFDDVHKKVDLVVGSRLKKGAIVKNRTIVREITSRGFNILLKAVLKVRFTDGMCGFKFVKKNVYDDLINKGIESDKWFFETELLIKAEWANYTIEEIPVCWFDDRASKVNLIATITEYLQDINRLRKKKKIVMK